ncbi:MmgE/PrpD family protein [Leucobacter denitrificans]|uniref:MmgE/PrpD family protein n=1 Tax=Leucobacter denitrificans TaxID=683042 RepID=A0A7G9S312_9MICO|nr:MmgE/PrpD family protein [Leucobacter denitrificans]QNN62237.1 MmgE/PrpD family protein [Leucobacter denitrificans]
MTSQEETLNVTRTVAEFAAGVAFEELPADVVERARLLALDGIACAFVGAKLPWAKKAVEAMSMVESGTGATLWGWGKSVSPSSAALLNGTFVQGFELDDFHAHGALHSSSVVVTAAMAAADIRPETTLGELLRAFVVGYEVGPRVGMAMGGGRLSTIGWHTGSVYGTAASAVAAGSVFGLDAANMESAIGNSVTRASGLMAAQYKSMVKRMHHGMAAQSGLVGAALASKGFAGTESVLEHPYGGLAAAILGDVDEADFSKLTDGLGENWILKTIGIKRYACLIMLHSTIDEMIAQRVQGLRDSDISRIRIGVAESVARRTSWKMEAPGKTLSAQMNLRFATAVALLDGAAYVEQFSQESLARPEVWDLMDRIDVYHDERIDALGRDRRFVTNIDIELTDGTTRTLVSTPPQDREFDAESVRVKFRGLVQGLIPDAKIDEIEQFILTASPDTPAAELSALLGTPSEPALSGLDS